MSFIFADIPNLPTTDNFDVVNVLKGQIAQESSDWNSDSKFDAEKDKNQFRRYEEACDRVKAFYKEQHGQC